MNKPVMTAVLLISLPACVELEAPAPELTDEASARVSLNLQGNANDNRLVGAGGDDTLLGDDGDDLLKGRGGNDRLEGGNDNDDLRGNRGQDELFGDDGEDRLDGGPDADVLTGGADADTFRFDGDAFDREDVSAPGRQIIGNEDAITDYEFGLDVIELDAEDHAVVQGAQFAAIDATVSGPLAEGVNVVVLLNPDDDGDPTTPFLAGTAANQIAGLVSEPTPGFFVYFNSNLELNRLVYSPDLSTADSDLKIVARFTDQVGADAINALSVFGAADFQFGGERIRGSQRDDELIGFGGDDRIRGRRGDDRIEGRGGADEVITGRGYDEIAFADDPFDGADVSAAGRQIVGNEDDVTDFDFHDDTFVVDGHDFGISDHVEFAAIDATQPSVHIDPEANVIVLLNADNDNDPTTPFLAGTAANQIATLGLDPQPGLFVYFNSNLQLNRLVYSTNLADATADLKIVARLSDRLGADAIAALGHFSEDNFEIE